MTITLSQNTNFGGASQAIQFAVTARNLRDVSDFQGSTVGRNPSSIRLNTGDAVLLCSKKNWKGETMYLANQRTIRDLGDPSLGGRQGFRNTVRSARVRPFLIELNVSIATGEDGTLPGGWADRQQAEADLDRLISMMNGFFRRELDLIRVKMSDITYRPSERFFNVSVQEYRQIPGSWKKSKKVDVVFTNRITGAVGVSSFPWHGKRVLMSASRSAAGVGFSRLEKIARTWVHELGHYWSLEHQSPITTQMISAMAVFNPALATIMTPNNDNVMIQSGRGGPFNTATLSNGQLNDIHQVLARNISRRRDRGEIIPNILI